jgi:hypothetical protein
VLKALSGSEYKNTIRRHFSFISEIAGGTVSIFSPRHVILKHI